MSDSALIIEKPPFGVRLPPDLAEFVEKMARESCNTKAGILHLAVKKMKEAHEAAQSEAAPQPGAEGGER